MAALAGVASVFSIIQLAGSVAKLSYIVCERLRDAPREIQELAVEAQRIRHVLVRLEQTLAISKGVLLTSTSELDLRLMLLEVNASLICVQKLLPPRGLGRSLSARTQWVLKARRAAERQMMSLVKSRERLDLLLQTIIMDGITKLLCSQDNMLVELQDTKTAVLTSSCTIFKTPEPTIVAEIVTIVPSIMTTTSTTRRRLLGPSRSVGRLLTLCGISGTWTTSFLPGENHVEHTFVARMPLSILWFLVRSKIKLRIRVRTSPNLPLSITASFAVARVVSRNHPFMLACRQDDVAQFEVMLRAGIGRVSDIDDRGWNPLALAIAFGNQSIIRKLLEFGVDLEAPIDDEQKTPLTWAVWHRQTDVVRQLLAAGASADTMDKDGWDPAFFCFSEPRRGRPCMLDCLRLLNELCVLDFTLTDSHGWAVVHRCAAYGTATQLRTLIAMNASPLLEAFPLCWNAIHHAVFYGNIETFELLLGYFENAATNVKDIRGWTLLHIAGEAGHVEIVRRLMELRADPLCAALPYNSHMAPALFEKRCTVFDVIIASHDSITAGRLLEALGTGPPSSLRSSKSQRLRIVEPGTAQFVALVCLLGATFIMAMWL